MTSISTRTVCEVVDDVKQHAHLLSGKRLFERCEVTEEKFDGRHAGGQIRRPLGQP